MSFLIYNIGDVFPSHCCQICGKALTELELAMPWLAKISRRAHSCRHDVRAIWRARRLIDIDRMDTNWRARYHLEKRRFLPAIAADVLPDQLSGALYPGLHVVLKNSAQRSFLAVLDIESGAWFWRVKDFITGEEIAANAITASEISAGAIRQPWPGAQP